MVKKIELATTVNILPGEWSETNQRVKRKNKHHIKNNNRLEAFDKKALKYILDNFINENTPLTLQQFKEYMLSSETSTDSFTDYILQYLNTNKARLRPESWWSYKSQITKMLKFKKQIRFADITEKFINDYQHYMKTTLQNNENTISKSLRSLRTFVNIAMRYGHIKKNPFQYITIKKVDGKRDFLTIQELNKLTTAYFTNKIKEEKERKVLQYFLFSCYTGLRYSDLKTLKRNTIKNNTLQTNMHKTNYLVTIPLSQKALSLLPINTSPTDTLFQVYCNKVTNRTLKQTAQKLKIKKRLTFHVARHTFATISIHLGIPIEVISKFLGHTSLKTTQIYAKIVDNVKEREMKKWNKL